MSTQASSSEAAQDHSIPTQLVNEDQWLCWEEVETDGRKRKMPRVPDGSGEPAKTSDPSTWGSFDEAYNACQQRKGVGLGFVLTEDDPYLAVDFDDVRDPDSGETEDWVLEAVDRWDAYAEVSPSETGIHVWLKGVTEPDWWVDTDHIEVYDSGQYITVTGEHLSDTPTRCATPSNFATWLESHATVEKSETVSQKPQNATQGHEKGVELGVYDVISHSSYPEGERVSHPYHGSSTGANFKVFDGGETWHCFRHDVSGNALHLIGMEQGVINCGDWKNRDLTDEEWAKLFEAGRSAGYDLSDPSDNSQQTTTPTSITEAITESQERWISPKDKTITVWDVGEQDAEEIKQVFEEQSLDSDTAMEITHGLNDKYSDAFSEYWNDSDDWTVRLATPEDKWQEVRDWYSESEGRKTARDLAVRLLREEYDFITVKDNEQMYCYDPETGIYRANAKQVVKGRLEGMLQGHYSRRETNEILARLEAGGYVDREEFGQSGSEVCVANGVLDIETGELTDFNPNYYFRSRIPVEYNPDADCPQFKSFLEDVCPDDKIPMLQEFVGYCLQPRMHHKKALLLLGPTDAGKSVFLNVLEALFGRESTVGLSVQYLASNRWGENELVGSMVNIRHDLDSSAIENAGKIKELTAGDRVRAEEKHQDPFFFQPRTKHIFSANQPPARTKEDSGFWNRWLTVVFPETIPYEEQDTKLSEKLTSEEELAGVLNWAVKGYQRLEERGRFTNGPRPEENRRLWEQYGNSVEQFVSQHLEREPSESVRKNKAYDAYKKFAKAEGMEVVTKHKFTSELKQKGASVNQRRFDGERERVYTGFQWSGERPDASATEELEGDIEELFG
jgi:putative DNA primase/helicase